MADRVINLAYTRKAAPVIVPVVQYTTAPDVVFVLEDYTPTGAATIYIDKPSGQEIYNHCTIEGNTVRFTPTTQCFAEVGENKAQLQILNDNKLAVSYLITFVVEENIIDSDAIESSDEFTELETAIATIGQYDDRMDQVEQDVADALVTVSDSLAATVTNVDNSLDAALSEIDTKLNGVIVSEPPEGVTLQTINSGLQINGYLSGQTDELMIAANLSLFGYDFWGVTNISALGRITGDTIVGENIGAVTFENPSAVSLPNGQWTNLGSVTLSNDSYYSTSPATFVLIGHATFNSNATGNRMIALTDTSGSGTHFQMAARDYRPAVNGQPTVCEFVCILTLAAGASRTLYLDGYQNSGGALSTTGRIQAVRIV